MSNILRSWTLFLGTTLFASAASAGAIAFTLDSIGKAAIVAPVSKRVMNISYVSSLPDVAPDAFDIARSVPVVPKTPAIRATLVAAVANTPDFTHTVATDSRVRSGPLKSTKHLFSLGAGTEVVASSEVKGWVKVTDANGRSGWVYGKLLNPVGDLVQPLR